MSVYRNKLFNILPSTRSAIAFYYDDRYPENLAERKIEVCSIRF